MAEKQKKTIVKNTHRIVPITFDHAFTY